MISRSWWVLFLTAPLPWVSGLPSFVLTEQERGESVKLAPTATVLPRSLPPEVQQGVIALQQALQPDSSGGPSSSIYRLLGHGSLRGFPTFGELQEAFGALVQQYPDYLTELQIGESVEGRPLLAYRLGFMHATLDPILSSDGSCLHDVNKTFSITKDQYLDHLITNQQSRLLLTALHHAREPASITSVLFFVTRILELGAASSLYYNRERHPPSQAEATLSALSRYILHTREIFVIPIVNPDGYEALRLSNNFEIRKNQRRTCRLTELLRHRAELQGVDLNRNYDFAFSKVHSPCDPQEYEGSHPFSEPETQAIKCLVGYGGFKAALNFHTFGNVWTYPFNCCPEVKMPGEIAAIYTEIQKSVLVPQYGSAPELEVLNYTTTGEADDWMLGQHGIIAFSPEVGSEEFGFWPPPPEILKMSMTEFWHIAAVALKTGPELGVSLRPVAKEERWRSGGSTIALQIINNGLAVYNNTGGEGADTLIIFRPDNVRSTRIALWRQGEGTLPFSPSAWTLAGGPPLNGTQSSDTSSEFRIDARERRVLVENDAANRKTVEQQRLRKRQRGRDHSNHYNRITQPLLPYAVQLPKQIPPRTAAEEVQVEWEGASNDASTTALCIVPNGSAANATSAAEEHAPCMCTHIQDRALEGQSIGKALVSSMDPVDSDDDLCISAKRQSIAATMRTAIRSPLSAPAAAAARVATTAEDGVPAVRAAPFRLQSQSASAAAESGVPVFIGAQLIFGVGFLFAFCVILSLEAGEASSRPINRFATAFMLSLSKFMCCLPCCLKYNRTLRAKCSSRVAVTGRIMSDAC